MRPIIAEVLEALLSGSAPGSELSLDSVGEAVGSRAVTAEEIAWLIDRLEAEGRSVGGPPSPSQIGALTRVLGSARSLRASLGRAATVAEIAEGTGMSEAEVRRALLLGKVMGR